MSDFLLKRIEEYLKCPQDGIPRIFVFLFFLIAVWIYPSFLIVNYMYSVGVYSFGIFSSDIYRLHLGLFGTLFFLFASVGVFGSLPYVVIRYAQLEKKGGKRALVTALSEIWMIIIANAFVIFLIALMYITSPDDVNYERLILISVYGLLFATILMSMLLCNAKMYYTLTTLIVVCLYVVGFVKPGLILDGTLTGFGLRAKKVQLKSSQSNSTEEGRLVFLSPTEAFLLQRGAPKANIYKRDIYDVVLYLNDREN